MPSITIDCTPHTNIPDGKRLVLAIEDSGVDILHRCGGYAKCTTCRVKFIEGEPQKMTQAEKERLKSEEGLYGRIRLSCQIICEDGMNVVPSYIMQNSMVDSPGKRPEDSITPEAIWTQKD
jgi:ferredoxin